jgi:hypothetical protein
LYFGTGFFLDDAGRYGFKDDRRPIHGAFSKILFGGGVIGLLSYLLIFFIIIIKSFHTIPQNINSFSFYNYRALMFALIAILLSVALTGGIGVGTGISFTGTTLLYIGYLNGLISKK